ncbi:uncharacterized membrane protein (UPF0127 family) [Methylobacterium aerolatum]|uniref:Uncharacterized membrane protein (UPF0127 family) n=2 Tax=Methylobacterium aerolatum TaxID=418708 RepID=A0ABU0HTK0_9HYPH|nr:uncharacterized membrane protein (UPF0127 family) [Methylobacterium aerolatum]GJD36236.1 hypothetical protein FMGBMHLM_3151 [Methylobacterium aerolatum]
MICVSRAVSTAALRLALAGACLVPTMAAPAAAQTVAKAPAVPTEPLTIATQGGPKRFAVEVMRDDAGRSRGLMFRRHMAADHGMLFDFERVQPVTMWMKNTYLSLDMVFIRADGTVARVAADTEPLSTAIIPSNEPVLAVLELNAGTAARAGIKPGDRIEHPLFAKAR